MILTLYHTKGEKKLSNAEKRSTIRRPNKGREDSTPRKVAQLKSPQSDLLDFIEFVLV